MACTRQRSSTINPASKGYTPLSSICTTTYISVRHLLLKNEPSILILIRADLRGASELAIAPSLAFKPSHPSISENLPLYQRTALEAAVRKAYHQKVDIDYHDEVCHALIDLAILMATIDLAMNQPGKLLFDSLQIFEGHISIVDQLLTKPKPIRTLSKALHGKSHEGFELSTLPQNSVRIAALFYLKLIRYGPPDTLEGSVHLLDLLNHHLRQMICLPLKYIAIHDISRGPLLWVCLVADQMAQKSQTQCWNWDSIVLDSTICRDCIQWLLGGGTQVDTSLIRDEDFEFCRLFPIGRAKGEFWDPSAQVQHILRGR